MALRFIRRKAPSAFPTYSTAADMPTEDNRRFWLTCTFQKDGAIRNGEGDVLFNYDRHGRQTRFSACSSAVSSQDEFIVDRRGMAPFSRWRVSHAGVVICEIRRRGLWRNVYTIAYTEGRQWSVRFPLFRIRFACTSNRDGQFYLNEVRHTHWLVTPFPVDEDMSLLVALSIVQCERMSA